MATARHATEDAGRQRRRLSRIDESRRRVLQDGLVACYEIIDRIRKELAELDAARKAAG